LLSPGTEANVPLHDDLLQFRPHQIMAAVGEWPRAQHLYANLTAALKISNNYPHENGEKGRFFAAAAGTALTGDPV
jgi:hypothetical protein